MGKIVFIHAADLHLDSPFAGLKNVPSFIKDRLRESSFQSFQRIVDIAIFRQVDFVLLAGDIYDSENRSLRTQIRFRKELERLGEAGIQVYMIHGNHDHLDGSWITVNLPENVHIFQAIPEVKRFRKEGGTAVNIYGYSYPRRHVTERIISRYEKRPDAEYHIGLLHGNLEGHTEHSPYAPFSKSELAEKEFDYWALGHVHKRQVISVDPPAVYPGNIQGRNRKETGDKGCYMVTLDNGAANYEFLETSTVLFDSIMIKPEAESGFDKVYTDCRRSMEEFHMDKKSFLLEIVLDLEKHSSPSIFTDEFIWGILESLQEEAETGEGFAWPYRIKVENGWRKDMDGVMENPFLNELLSLETDSNGVNGALEQLYKHREARKFLAPLEDEETKELLSESQRLILQLFH
ncbi:metallophosphoesterase family protein [Peribacillus glennii]|uniref:metallophosphoesterase family protein n=1 Tax=Peribacillus glennii TaxID=2303991 RepID=UPI001314D29E|nr:DNA repair exonuclease [Peribacillus glennii]